MVWCSVLSCGVVWCGVVGCDVGWCGLWWCGGVGCGVGGVGCGSRGRLGLVKAWLSLVDDGVAKSNGPCASLVCTVVAAGAWLLLGGKA